MLAAVSVVKLINHNLGASPKRSPFAENNKETQPLIEGWAREGSAEPNLGMKIYLLTQRWHLPASCWEQPVLFPRSSALQNLPLAGQPFPWLPCSDSALLTQAPPDPQPWKSLLGRGVSGQFLPPSKPRVGSGEGAGLGLGRPGVEFARSQGGLGALPPLSALEVGAFCKGPWIPGEKAGCKSK